jgi:hypothetical protein
MLSPTELQESSELVPQNCLEGGRHSKKWSSEEQFNFVLPTFECQMNTDQRQIGRKEAS